MLDWKKYLVSVVVIFAVYTALGHLIHEILYRGGFLGPLAKFMRPDPEMWKRMPLAYFSHLLLALAFCFIYTKGIEVGKHWLGQGIRFGLLQQPWWWCPPHWFSTWPIRYRWAWC